MTTRIVEMRVEMDCPGCQAKVLKALSKLTGVYDVQIESETQKVSVIGWVDHEKLLTTVRKKTGKRAELWPYLPPYQYSPRYYDHLRPRPTPTPLSIISQQLATMFSDDNPTACAIM